MQQNPSIASPSAEVLAMPRPRTRTQRILRVLARKRLFTASIVLLGIIGTVLFYLVGVVERILVPWHVSQRGGHGGSAHGA